MKKEVVELVKAVVRKQLKEKMLEHDERLAELQRLVTNLQDVIRQQSVMLQESANQLLAFEQSKQQKSPKSVTKDSFIPRPPAIASTHSRSSLLPSVGAAVPNTGATVRPSGIKPPRSSERLSRLPAPSNNHGNHGTMATSKSTTSSTSSLGYAKR
ncbi:TPA: hypothetical protein N0F65_002061 [Lagenidium giganteum]|uniref:Uncharacterized protein n=1 Tax=Lagenidium giganteum TaxID=4803 RepID=A0AAV2ZEC5_9STRA|nr:TPA: hypothetical protein N0F65_002061 [Lagenidium giganteum]